MRRGKRSASSMVLASPIWKVKHGVLLLGGLMPRELQIALIIILIPFSFFLLWSFPGYMGIASAFAAMALSILLYVQLQRRYPTL